MRRWRPLALGLTAVLIGLASHATAAAPSARSRPSAQAFLSNSPRFSIAETISGRRASISGNCAIPVCVSKSVSVGDELAASVTVREKHADTGYVVLDCEARVGDRRAHVLF